MYDIPYDIWYGLQQVKLIVSIKNRIAYVKTDISPQTWKLNLEDIQGKFPFDLLCYLTDTKEEHKLNGKAIFAIYNERNPIKEQIVGFKRLTSDEDFYFHQLFSSGQPQLPRSIEKCLEQKKFEEEVEMLKKNHIDIHNNNSLPYPYNSDFNAQTIDQFLMEQDFDWL